VQARAAECAVSEGPPGAPQALAGSAPLKTCPGRGSPVPVRRDFQHTFAVNRMRGRAAACTASLSGPGCFDPFAVGWPSVSRFRSQFRGWYPHRVFVCGLGGVPPIRRHIVGWDQRGAIACDFDRITRSAVNR